MLYIFRIVLIHPGLMLLLNDEFNISKQKSRLHGEQIFIDNVLAKKNIAFR